MPSHLSLPVLQTSVARSRVVTPVLRFDTAAKRWRRLVVYSFVSEDAAFDARRAAPVKPPPRFVVCADRGVHSRPVANTRLRAMAVA